MLCLRGDTWRNFATKRARNVLALQEFMSPSTEYRDVPVRCGPGPGPVRVRSGPGPGFIFSVRVVRSGSENLIPDPLRSGSQNFSGPGNPVRVGSYVTRPVASPGFIFCWSVPCFPAIFFVYNYPFSSYLSLGSMLVRLDLKKYADCTHQRLKRTSGARVMTFLL